MVFEKALIPLLQGGVSRQPMTLDLALKADKFVRLGVTGYDACYAALAKDMKGLWLTFDDKAHRMIQKERVSCLLTEKFPETW